MTKQTVLFGGATATQKATTRRRLMMKTTLRWQPLKVRIKEVSKKLTGIYKDQNMPSLARRVARSDKNYFDQLMRGMLR